jgi:RNA polymerase sigma factor (sigma-70 family)
MSKQTSARAPGRPMVMAVVLGTALSAMGAAPANAATASHDHETTLRAIQDMDRYCSVCWRNARLPTTCWDDCTQEVFRRLLQRVPTTVWGELLRGEGPERKEFLRAIDAVKKRTQRARKFSGTLEGVADGRDAEQRRLLDDREIVHRAAREVLTERQQHILQLSLEGWSVHQIAAELAVAAERISDEKYKAIRKLREHLSEQTAVLG